MTLIVCWLAFPLVLALVCAGLGLLLERATGAGLATSLLLPAGFALLVVVTSLTTMSGATAPLTTPLVAVLAVAGLALGARRRARPISGPGVAAVLGVLGVAAAPVVLTGAAGFAGYTQLDDISTFLALASRTIGHGRDLAGLPPSTYEATLAVNLRAGYPLGSLVPLAALRPLVGQDLAWVWQPYLTCVLGLLALCLWSLARPLRARPWLRAAAVFLAAQAALLYAFALEGAVKELPVAMLAALATALAARVAREPERLATAVVVGVAVAAILCVLGLGGLAYAGTIAAALAAGALLVGGRTRTALRRLARFEALAGAVAVLLALPVAATGGFASAGADLLQNETDIGNLLHALDWRQVAGVWPAGDFRTGLGQGRGLAVALIWVVTVTAAAGSVAVVRRRELGPALFAATTLGALVGLSAFGSSPWIDSKAMAIASPAVVLLAAIAAAALLESRRRIVGALALAAIAAGVLWSNWLAYRDVRLAPRDRLAELAGVGDRFAGQGPTLIDEYEPYGARYFLRRTDPEAPAELRRRVIPLRSGEGLGKAQWAPLDEFRWSALAVYRTIVVRRSPAESRPPPGYELRASGDYYDVWQRQLRLPSRVIAYSIFGDQLNAAARPPCAAVGRLAALARRRHARLAAAVRPPATVADAAPATHGDRAAPVPVAVGRSGGYDVWLQGSFARGATVAIDGRRVGTARDELSFAGQWIRLGARRLAAGRHAVELSDPGGGLRPGGGRQPQQVGPLALVPRSPRPALVTLAPTRARALCGMSLDWLAVVATAAR